MTNSGLYLFTHHAFNPTNSALIFSWNWSKITAIEKNGKQVFFPPNWKISKRNRTSSQMIKILGMRQGFNLVFSRQ
jgi:hypothetical protein